jgi:hypothetical protein
MRTEHLYIWRILWTGKWCNTRYHCTEERILFEHPEAVRLENTLIVHEVPETDAEMQGMGRVGNSHWSGDVPRHPDGTVKKMWER